MTFASTAAWTVGKERSRPIVAATSAPKPLVTGASCSTSARPVRLTDSITRVTSHGIDPQRILLAGFSQGGAIALTAGLRRKTPLGGLIALSTYLPGAEAAGESLGEGATTQPIFMAHGAADPVIPLMHAERSAQLLQSFGFVVEWHRYPMAHQVCAEEISALADWMAQRFAHS